MASTKVRPSSKRDSRLGWRYMLQGTANQAAPVFVHYISGRGTAYFVKPNPWYDKVGDRRAGWTGIRTALPSQFIRHRPSAPLVRSILAFIGTPPVRLGSPR